MSQKTRRRLIISLVISIAVSAFLSALLTQGFLRPLQLTSSDLVVRLRDETQEKFLNDTRAKFVTIVTIDDRSLAALRDRGRFFNWPRDLHAQVIDNLKAAGARMIVWDVIFDAPAAGDEALAASIQRAGNVILAEAPDGATSLPPTSERPLRFREAIHQLPIFRDVAHAIGHAVQEPDTDGTIRAVPLLIEVGGEDVPALPLAGVAKFLRRPQIIEHPIVDGYMEFAGRQIPVDAQGRLWISYFGDSTEVTNPPTFPVISYVDALNNQLDPQLVRGRLLVVGMTATGFADDLWTPVSRYSKMDGVEIHANAMETILRPEMFIVPAGQRTTIGYIIAAGFVAALALGLLPPLPALVVGVIASGAYFLAAQYFVDNVVRTGGPLDQLFPRTGVILDLSYPLLSLWLSYLLVLFYRIIFEQAQQRALRGALSQYLSPAVMEEVVRDPESLKLGGEKREMTVLFSDIRGFTSISEALEPEHLVHILNVYLTRMSDVVFKHQGTIDKYMGDAIMAFWGAPKLQPDHARLACLTALEMVEKLDRLNDEFRREGIPPLHIGIGLNTGPMSVGNMGSARRFDYTVMGDAVNLGSRLEGLNKEYGTGVIASERTLELAGPDIRARFLDLVAVKGKKEPVRVFELLGRDGSTDGVPAELLRAYERGIERYRARDFTGALAQFQEALAADDQDGPSRVYALRSEELVESPPPEDWDGVFVMTHK